MNSEDKGAGSTSSRVVVAYRPAMESYTYNLHLWYDQHIVAAECDWKVAPTFDCFRDHCQAALRQYLHLCHLDFYTMWSCESDSKGKLSKLPMEVPRFVRDMFRELARPMQFRQTVLIPYLPLDGDGTGPAPGLGIQGGQFLMLPNMIKQHFSTEADFVLIEAEQPKILPLSFDADCGIYHFSGVPEWRKKAFEALRSLKGAAEFFTLVRGKRTVSTDVAVNTALRGRHAVASLPLRQPPGPPVQEPHPFTSLHVNSAAGGAATTINCCLDYGEYVVKPHRGMVAAPYPGTASANEQLIVDDLVTRVGPTAIQNILDLFYAHFVTPTEVMRNRGVMPYLLQEVEFHTRFPADHDIVCVGSAFPSESSSRFSKTPPPSGKSTTTKPPRSRGGRVAKKMAEYEAPTPAEAPPSARPKGKQAVGAAAAVTAKK